METLAMIFYGVVFILALGGLSLISFILSRSVDRNKNFATPISRFPRKYDEHNDESEHDHSKVA